MKTEIQHFLRFKRRSELLPLTYQFRQKSKIVNENVYKKIESKANELQNSIFSNKWRKRTIPERVQCSHTSGASVTSWRVPVLFSTQITSSTFYNICIINSNHYFQLNEKLRMKEINCK